MKDYEREAQRDLWRKTEGEIVCGERERKTLMEVKTKREEIKWDRQCYLSWNPSVLSHLC